MKQEDYVGSVSGEKVDKSEVFDFERGEDGTPIIKEAPLAIECKVEDILRTGEIIGKCLSLKEEYKASK